MPKKSVAASLGYGIGLFVILGIGFALLIVAIMPSPAAGQPNGLGEAMSALMSGLIGLIITALVLVFGPLEGMVVGVVLGLRYRGEPIRGFATGLVSTLVGFAILAVILLAAVASTLPRVPEQPPPQQALPMQEGWRLVLALVATCFVGGVTGAIVSSATKEKPLAAPPTGQG